MGEAVESINHKQERALVALLEQPTVVDAAAAANISKTTLYKWLKGIDFRQRYLAARRDAVSHAVGRLQQAMTGAVETLETIAADPQAPPAARIAAARTIISQAIKGVEVEDLMARIERLENLEQQP